MIRLLEIEVCLCWDVVACEVYNKNKKYMHISYIENN